jgi:hypothetical protein
MSRTLAFVSPSPPGALLPCPSSTDPYFSVKLAVRQGVLRPAESVARTSSR